MNTAIVEMRRLPGILIRPGNALFRRRNLIFPVGFVVVMLAGRPRFPFGSQHADQWMDAFGVLTMLAGQLIRAMVIGLAYIQRGGKAGRVHAESLVEEGVFAHCRNPLYLGNILIFLGIFTVVNSWAGWIVGVPAVLFAYLAIVAAEEDFLRRQFGSRYEDYCQRVHRLWPSLRGLRKTAESFHFNGRRVVRKEYGSTFAWTTIVLVLLVLERIANGGAERVRTTWAFYAGAWGLLFMAYLTARFLKKTGRL